MIENTATEPRTILDGLPESIIASERRGQRQFVASQQIPVDGSDAPEIAAAGIVVGEVTPGDRIFRAATLPAGWKKVGTDHDMWSKIVDENGAERFSIFYKAAFYDRSAFIRYVRPK